MDVLSSQERRLIDEAILKGRVQKVPLGKSGLNDDIIYDGISGRLRYKDKEFAKQRKSTTTKKRNRKVAPDIAARRMRVLDFLQMGMSGPEIAKKLNIKLSMVYNDVVALGETFTRHAPDEKPSPERLKVKNAFDGQRTINEISSITGLSVKSVTHHLKSLGLVAPKGKPGPKEGTERSRAIEARRKMIPQLIEQGLRGPDIAKMYGVNNSTIHNDCRVIGISIPRSNRVAKQ